jgi:hypothetical protein
VEDVIFGFDLSRQWEYENGFYLTSHSSRLAKSIMHWELYKHIINLPGEIVECGVYKGASLIRFATFREMSESQYSRKIIGFDIFGKFPITEDLDDNQFIQGFENAGGDGIPKTDLMNVLSKKGFDNIELIEGNVLDTIPSYIEKNPHLKVALLHIDVDVYNATKCSLENLFDKVVTGGVIILDDYGTAPGETRAVDEFINTKSRNILIQKNPFYKVPCYIIKE